MTELFREIAGNVLQPERQLEKSRLVILNNVSNVGTWDSAQSIAISAADAGAVEAAYKKWFSEEFYEDAKTGVQVAFGLGNVKFDAFKAVPGAAICNVIALQGVSAEEDKRSPIRYYAVSQALTEVYKRLAESAASGAKIEVIVSRDFAGDGSWNWIGLLLKELAMETGIPTTVYKSA